METKSMAILELTKERIAQKAKGAFRGRSNETDTIL